MEPIINLDAKVLDMIFMPGFEFENFPWILISVPNCLKVINIKTNECFVLGENAGLTDGYFEGRMVFVDEDNGKYPSLVIMKQSDTIQKFKFNF